MCVGRSWGVGGWQHREEEGTKSKEEIEKRLASQSAHHHSTTAPHVFLLPKLKRARCTCGIGPILLYTYLLAMFLPALLLLPVILSILPSVLPSFFFFLSLPLVLIQVTPLLRSPLFPLQILLTLWHVKYDRLSHLPFFFFSLPSS